MRRKITSLILICFTLLFLSCEMDGETAFSSIINSPTTLSDARFNGDFVYFYYWEDSSGIEENTQYTSFSFDGTNKVFYYNYYKRYSKTSGWSYSGDYIGDHYSWYLEFEVRSGEYRRKLWDNSFSEWSNWEKYEFSSDGKILTLFNYYNISGNNKVLKKQEP